MGGPFDRTGTNTADETIQPTPQTGDVEDRGVIFGPSDDITIDQPTADSGQASDSGILFGPTDSISIVPEEAEVGTFMDSGLIFGGREELTGVPTGGGGTADGNTTYDLIRDDDDIVLVGSDGSRDAVTAGGATGTGIDFVDSLPAGTVEDIVITNSDWRTWARGTNVWAQTGGQNSIQVQHTTQMNDIVGDPPADTDWALIPTYFYGGGER